MFKLFVLFCVLLAINVFAYERTFEILPPQVPPPHFAGRTGCYIPELDKMIAYGEQYTPPSQLPIYFCWHTGRLWIFYKNTINLASKDKPANTSQIHRLLK